MLWEKLFKARFSLSKKMDVEKPTEDKESLRKCVFAEMVQECEKQIDIMELARRKAKKTTEDILRECNNDERCLEELMEVCENKYELFWPCILELLNEKAYLRNKHQTEILKWIIINNSEKLLLDFISNLVLTVNDVEVMYKKTGYLLETGDVRRGQVTLYGMLSWMEIKELRKFFEIVSQDANMREATIENFDIIRRAVTLDSGYATEALSILVEFFPECSEKAFTNILRKNCYTSECRLELHVLRMIADGRYGYVFSNYGQYHRLKKWVYDNAEHILVASRRYYCIPDIAWILENEFEVDISNFQTLFDDQLWEWLTYQEVNSEEDEEELETYMKFSCGYYALWGSRYDLARLFPEGVVEIKSTFPNTDSEQLLIEAGAEE